jgi:hypothetical protein
VSQISIPATCAPLCANATAAARPIPRAAPVTTASFPSSRFVQPEIGSFIGTLQLQKAYIKAASANHLDAFEAGQGAPSTLALASIALITLRSHPPGKPSGFKVKRMTGPAIAGLPNTQSAIRTGSHTP